MKLFLSDLHIASRLFKKVDYVIDLIKRASITEIYIIGDLFDTWDEDPFITAIRHERLIDVINNVDKKVVIIKGNHDPSIDDLKLIFPKAEICDKYELTLFNRKTILIHGDSVDKSVFFGKLLYPLHYIFSMFGINLKAFARKLVHDLLRKKLDVPYDSLILDMEKRIFDKYSKDYDIIICGHTHLKKLVRIGDKSYLNCGSLIFRPSYLIADDEKVVLWRI